MILCETNERVRGKLMAAGILSREGDDPYSTTLAEALRRAGVSPGGLDTPVATS